jgi:dihydroorotate dehydrogenase
MYRWIRPALFALDPETAHRLVFGTLRVLGPVGRAVARGFFGPPDRRLRTELAGLSLAGPIGLAAGLDKDGVLARFWETLGFGFAELGTVTALPQPGNPRPRLFRFPEARALVNRMGFNNQGSERLAERLGRTHDGCRIPIGANLGKSKATEIERSFDDYRMSARRLAGVVDYLVVNVSSPNTAGLRSLQDPARLGDLVAGVVAEAKGRPVFVKLGPDLDDRALEEACRVAEARGARGILATNTTLERHGLPEVGPGGLSGAPLAPRALACIRVAARATSLPVIGVGGIEDLAGVLDAFRAGAAAVQIFTGLVFHGPGLVSRLNRQLAATLDARGLRDLAELRASLREARDG